MMTTSIFHGFQYFNARDGINSFNNTGTILTEYEVQSCRRNAPLPRRSRMMGVANHFGKPTQQSGKKRTGTMFVKSKRREERGGRTGEGVGGGAPNQLNNS